MDFDRLAELNRALEQVDEQISKEKSLFLDDPHLQKLKQYRKIIQKEIKRISDEA